MKKTVKNNTNLQRHKKIKQTLKIIGFVSAVAGLAFFNIGFMSFFDSVAKHEMPTKFWCFFVAILLLFIGISSLSLGYKKEIARYAKNESVPIINETSREITPAVENVKQKYSMRMRTNSKFCKHCGRAITLICNNCGATLSPDSVYCDKCGTKLK